MLPRDCGCYVLALGLLFACAVAAVWGGLGWLVRWLVQRAW